MYHILIFINITASVNTTFQTLWFRSECPWSKVDAVNTEVIGTQIPSVEVEVITSKVSQSQSWLGYLPLWNICVKDDFGYLLEDTSSSFFPVHLFWPNACH